MDLDPKVALLILGGVYLVAGLVEKVTTIRRAIIGGTDAQVAELKAQLAGAISRLETTNESQWNRINGGLANHLAKLEEHGNRLTRVETKLEDRRP